MFGGLGSPLGAADAILSPVWQYAMPEFTYALGFNTASRDRYNLYRNNWEACLYPRGPDRTPTRLGFAQLMQLFNQSPWVAADEDADLFEQIWTQLRNDLRRLGIDMRPFSALVAGEPITLNGEFAADQWTRLIHMSCSAAPLGNVLRDYFRSLPLPDENKAVTEEELRFNLQRSQFRRKEDRDRLLEPFADWSPDEISQLKWRGLINHNVETSLMNAAGICRSEDYRLREYFEQRMPDPATLIKWQGRYLWDQEIEHLFQLDQGWAESRIAKFFAKSQGIGAVQRPLPDQPDGESDWAKLAHRAGKKLPSWRECRELQWRCRDREDSHGDSIIPNVHTWGDRETIVSLRAEGWPEPIIERLMGTIDEPMPMHLLATVLTPILEHPAIRQLANQLFPGPGDFVKEALLDHGYSDKVAALSAAAIRQEAKDKANAERYATEKQQRVQNRTNWFEAYEIGTIDKGGIIAKVVETHFTEAMANHELVLIDKRLDNELAKVKINALQEAFMTGQKTADQVKQGFTLINIDQPRVDRYIEEWTWARGNNQKHLVTGEIMQAMKAGLMQAPQAIQRLTNLGWNQPDAMIEVQLVQHELAVAQAKAQAVAVAHAKAQAVAMTKAQQIAAAHAKALAAKQALLQAKISKEQLLATHQKLMAESEYYAKVHMANSAYAEAEKKGDLEKQAGELFKEQAAYQDYLIKQLDLISEGTQVAHAVGPLQTAQAPGPQPNPATDGTQGTPNPPGGGPGGKDSGNGKPAAP